MAGAQDLTEQEMQPLNFNELLKILQIKLPTPVTAVDVDRSKQPNVIKDAQDIMGLLTSGVYILDKSPRLACYNIVQPLKQKDEGNVREITKDLFLRVRVENSPTLKTFWDKKACQQNTKRKNLTMRNTYVQQRMYLTDVTKTNLGSDFSEKDVNTCLDFYTEERGKEDVRKNYQKMEFGFISGKIKYIENYSHGNQNEKKIIKCYVTSENLEGNLFTNSEVNREVQLKTNHRIYKQTLAYQYILQKKDSTVPVSAVIVVKDKTEKKPKFYCGDVANDTSEIEQLDNFCQEQALPRFLALLNLIFERKSRK